MQMLENETVLTPIQGHHEEAPFHHYSLTLSLCNDAMGWLFWPHLAYKLKLNRKISLVQLFTFKKLA